MPRTGRWNLFAAAAGTALALPMILASHCDKDAPTSDFLSTPTATPRTATPVSSSPTPTVPPPTLTEVPFTPLPTVTRTEIPFTPLPTVTVTPAFNFQIFAGDYSVLATKAQDTGCNFSATFNGTVSMTVNPDGTNLTIRMIERLTRQYSGAIQSGGSFSGTGSGNLDGFAYNGSITGQITGKAMQGSEVLNFTSGCPGKQVVYSFAGAKP